MDNIYYFETIEECEKQIIDKAIITDITYASNHNLLECFTRIINTIAILVAIIIVIISIIAGKWDTMIQTIAMYVALHITFTGIIGWVKFNHNKTYTNIKFNLVDGIIERCKEWNETDYEDWQRKQMLKRFASLAGVSIDLDKVK